MILNNGKGDRKLVSDDAEGLADRVAALKGRGYREEVDGVLLPEAGATPAAIEAAAASGETDLGTVPGTGKRGRVTKNDVEAAGGDE